MHWLRIKLFWYSDITSADLGIEVSFAGPMLRSWISFGSNRRTAEINRPKPSSDLSITTLPDQQNIAAQPHMAFNTAIW